MWQLRGALLLRLRFRCAVPPRSPLASGVTKASWPSCPKSMRPISPGRDSKRQKKTSLPAPRRATTIRCRGIGCHTSMAAGAPAGPRERSSSSARGIPTSLLRPIAWRKKCGPGASRPRPIAAYFAGVARQNGHPKGWVEVRSPGDHLGRGMHGTPPHARDLPWLARGSRRPGHLLWWPGAATANRRRNATRVAPRHRRLLRGGRGGSPGTPFSRTSKSGSACSPARSSAKRYERHFLVASVGNASWRPGSHEISSWPRDWRSVTGPRSCCSSAMRSISRTPPYLYYTTPKTLGGKTSWSPSLAPC